MPDQARVTSIAAIEAFRSALVVYLGKSRRLVEEACEEVTRTRVWLEQEQRPWAENQVRRWTKELEQARQAYFTASIASLREPTGLQREAIHRAKRNLEQAEERLRTVKRWDRDFDNSVAPLVKQLDSLRTLLSTDLPQGVAHLARIIENLESYAGYYSGPSPTPMSELSGTAGIEPLENNDTASVQEEPPGAKETT